MEKITRTSDVVAQERKDSMLKAKSAFLASHTLEACIKARAISGFGRTYCDYTYTYADENGVSVSAEGKVTLIDFCAKASRQSANKQITMLAYAIPTFISLAEKGTDKDRQDFYARTTGYVSEYIRLCGGGTISINKQDVKSILRSGYKSNCAGNDDVMKNAIRVAIEGVYYRIVKGATRVDAVQARDDAKQKAKDMKVA